VSPLRLGSFNLFSGRSLTDGVINTDRLVEAVRALDVDLLAVQEVDRNQPRSSGVDQAAVVAETLRAVDHRFVPALDGTPGAGWLPSVPHHDQVGGVRAHHGPQFGVALISRLPVAEWHELRLSPARGRFPMPIPSRPPRVLWLNDEPRVAVAAVLEHPRITIACTHLSFVPTSTARQLTLVREWLARLPGPHLLLGDLNLPAVAVRRLTTWTPLVSAATFPAPSPRLQLDHVLASGLEPGTRALGRVEQLSISDHRAVLVDLHLNQPGG
jgi:endonuclease/exonuclease/phosphatase family metal-dependent hydrolase